MSSRAADLIASLNLAAHPEGGHFRELHRSPAVVRTGDGRGERSAVTGIYYLLATGEASRWHRVASDEVWHYYEGDQLELLTADPEFRHVAPVLLGPAGEGVEPVRVVPANHWQAARPTGLYTLCGCTVAPGFDFADFEMLADRPAEAAALRQRQPQWAFLE